ncbi:methylosome subunit pICln-like isoform X2 [Ptychodera flava]|uniref:methylosome subunit pICln-like isoform X2 n=1 Tax=Ptychodera flava TaxID=63121 RepID=UPI00396A23E7
MAETLVRGFYISQKGKNSVDYFLQICVILKTHINSSIHSRLSWTDVSGKGFSLEYPAISLHAVSRDLSSFPHECLYVMVDYNLDSEITTDRIEDEDSDNNEEQSPITEIRFIPEDKSCLDNMFDAMAKCQALHPDEEDSDVEDEHNYEDADEEEEEEEIVEGEGDGEWYTGPEGAEDLTEEGRATLQRLENLLLLGQQHQSASDTMETGDHSEPTTQASSAATNGVEAMEMDTGQFDDAEPDH